jgi:hypothetical protein
MDLGVQRIDALYFTRDVPRKDTIQTGQNIDQKSRCSDA